MPVPCKSHWILRLFGSLYCENDDNEYPLNISTPSFDTAVSSIETVMKFVRTLPCSEKQSQSANWVSSGI